MNATKGFIPDIGGGRGYSLSFSDQNSYASVNGYFTSSNQWAVNDMSMSVWIRWVGMPTGISSWAFTLIAANDPKHFKLGLNGRRTEKNWILNIQQQINGLSFFAPVKNIDSYSKYWTHATVTRNLTAISIYFNGTLIMTTPGTGLPLRWADTSALFLGGFVLQQVSDATLVMADQTVRFYGWMDDLAFYNRVLSRQEIAKNWQQAVDVTDPSLFLYYNFDEGPGSAVIKNYGTVGTQGDLYNGLILGSTTYLEFNSNSIFSVKKAIFSPGALVIGASNSLPIVFAVDPGVSVRLRIACQLTATTTTTASLIPSQAQFLSLPSGTGKIYQIDPSQTPITTPNTMLTSTAAEFWYYTSGTSTSGSPVMDSLQYSCVCNGVTQTGTINVIINSAVVPDPKISIVAVAGTTTKLNVHGSLANPGLMKVNITSLPTHGRLSQYDFVQPKLLTYIVQPGTQVTNTINNLQYIPTDGFIGTDTFSYQLIHNGIVSNAATVKLSVQSWDYPPVIPSLASAHPVIILNRQATSLNLPVKDNQQKQYLGMYIMSLPTKGTLYQRNVDGSLGAVIDKPFQYSFSPQTIQYASKILNVSSFRVSAGASWNPIQALGPQDCIGYGGCSNAWIPNTFSGTGGFAKGCGQGICFASNPDLNYANFGYTEYIELGFNTSVIVNQLINGEPDGMGAVKNILAKDPLGNWMTLWTAPTLDNTIQKYFINFNQYRYSTPDICQTPFFTKQIRYEIDTRDVTGYSEFDYFELYGLSVIDASMVNWYGNGKWDVIYVPHKDASGLDSFTYSATDCPGTLRVGFAQHWSPNVGTVNINIVPVGTAGTAKIDPSKGTAKVDLSTWSVNTTSSSSSSQINKQPFTFTIATLPTSSSGFLIDAKGVPILNVPYSLNDSRVWFHSVPCCTASTCTQDQIQQQQQTNNHTSFTYLSSDMNSKGPLTVSLAVMCPFVTANVNASKDVGIPIAIALAVIIFVVGIACSLRQYLLIREAQRQEKRRLEEEAAAAAKLAMQKLEEAAKCAEEDAKRSAAEQERERRLRHELQENILNTAHDIKSPTTALGLAVESLLYALDKKKPLTEVKREIMIRSLHDMMHTIESLTMIINRSTDACLTATSSSRGIHPNLVPVHLKQVVDEIGAFTKWQADGTGIEVIVDPLPTDLPHEIMMDERWLKDDALCLAGNCVKFSRKSQKTPAVMRVSIVPSPTVSDVNLPSSSSSSVQFSFIDSGYPLSEERLTNLFKRPKAHERTQVGGMGLGLYCLSEHINALEGQCGARKRSDGHEGTEIWFSFPLIVPRSDLYSYEDDEDNDYIHEANKFHFNQSLKFDGEIVSMKNNVTHATAVTTTVAEKSLFSAPQNRRASMTRHSKELGQFIGSSTSDGAKAVPSEGVDIPVYGAATVVTGSSPTVVASMDDTSIRTIDDLRATETTTRGSTKTSADRMKALVGTSPMLIVDDSVSILKMTKRAILNECDSISFIEAKDGKEAFERVAESHTDIEIVVTDIQMPVCNGFDFTRQVRQLERDNGLTPKLIIGISANEQPKITIEAKESGMDGFMQKPFKLSTLIDVIEDISSRRKHVHQQGSNVRGSFGTRLPPMRPSEVGDGNVSVLEHEGTLPTAAVVVSAESETKMKEVSDKTSTEYAHPTIENGSTNVGFRGRRKSDAKIYADNN